MVDTIDANWSKPDGSRDFVAEHLCGGISGVGVD